MDFGEKDVKHFSTLLLILCLVVLSYFILRPILISTISGLILAYIFAPLYKKLVKLVKNPTLAASTVSFVVVAVIFIPLWFVAPLMIQQVYDVYTYYQTIDTHAFARSIFPGASTQFISQADAVIGNFIGTVSTYVSNTLLNFVFSLPYFLLDLFILAFVFFYALRDADRLISFVKAVSPLEESHEKMIVKQFKDMTDSLIYGQFIVGLVQGLSAGLGFALFGVNNALILTILAVFFSIIPFIGPSIIWIPVNIYLFSTGNMVLGTAYLLYNLLIVSVLDNIIRSYLISRKIDISPAIILLGMIGGMYAFSLLGLIIGPLILAYLVTILESFKDKSFYTLFNAKSILK